MSQLTIQPAKSLHGDITLPGDKSISHRAFLFSAISQGTGRITHCLESGDVGTTRHALEALGVVIHQKGGEIVIEGRGKDGFISPREPLDMGNSGTTTRLLLGLLAGCSFRATLIGDSSLSRRPMRRVTEPLQKMGARITGPHGPDRLPLTIEGGRLRGMKYGLPLPSAQVKSALLLAGLFAEGKTTVVETIPTRDHTERMLRFFGADVERNGSEISVSSAGNLIARSVKIPGDISSAAFFLVGAAIIPHSAVTVRNVGLNPTRTGFLDLLQKMGAQVEIEPQTGSEEWEPVGNVTVTSSSLQGATVESEMIPRLIDELPILMVAATQAHGTTIIEGAGELRVKETDRIRSMVTGLTAMGARMTVEGERITIYGPTSLKGTRLSSFGDHRTAMSLAIAGLIAEGPTAVEESEWIDISFPSFMEKLTSLR